MIWLTGAYFAIHALLPSLCKRSETNTSVPFTDMYIHHTPPEAAFRSYHSLIVGSAFY